jgi:phosphatidylglycerophosphatase A
VATGLGSGYSPLAPGTAGSLVGLVLYWPLQRLPLLWQVTTLGLVFGWGVICASYVVRQVGDPDPGIVVVDEVVGMWASLLYLPFTWATAVTAFLMFRAMDIFKPYPARDLESLPGGWGIMADDLMAGIYANLLLRVALRVWPVS